MLEDGRDREQIEHDLIGKGHDGEWVKGLVKDTMKLRHDARRGQGMNLVAAGAIICFSSFLLTITSSFSHSSFPYVLFGLTSVGVVVAFCGLVKVF